MPMPDQTSDPRSGTLFRFGCVEDDEKDGEHAEARGEPDDEAALAGGLSSTVRRVLPQVEAADDGDRGTAS